MQTPELCRATVIAASRRRHAGCEESGHSEAAPVAPMGPPRRADNFFEGIPMSKCRAVLAAALLGAGAASSHATVVALAADGAWNAFNVDALVARSSGVEWIDSANTLSPGFGTPLEFTFTVPGGSRGRLTVVDAGFSGDTFRVDDAGRPLGTTSAVVVQTFSAGSVDVGTNFDAALADLRFSRATFDLDPGAWRIGGALEQSVLDGGGAALDSTIGALKLSIFAVPEPSSWTTLAAGLATLVFIRRHRRD